MGYEKCCTELHFAPSEEIYGFELHNRVNYI